MIYFYLDPRKKPLYSCTLNDNMLVTGATEGIVSIW
jgi:hypothetical protein